MAHRMLGSPTEADDAVQESWLRLSRTGAGDVDNLAAWLTTVVGRVCLDMLRSRTIRREEPLESHGDESPAGGTDPEREAVLADSVGLALLVVLDTLTPTERLAFVLHDLFAVSFDDIAVVVGRSPAAARQLASRARRRVQAAPATPDADVSRQRRIVGAFLTAARGGDMATLLTLLDPDVVMRADETAARMGSTGESRGAEVVARFFAGRAQGALPADVDGAAGAVVAADGRTRLALSFIVVGDRILGIEVVADPEQLEELEVTLLG
ncbi:sigma-70 family RNA polymerase sigma factor [Dactylosporangium fulvum]|uniref:Sigma-70 family RNA polymerase sigma factor n=1 Tax=Dactylosporangium fulvum TaxID=53359 RepID=A0ABY5WBI2_9ACTN|nr:sigma-70 family RNA polymerase sigma factor [Dactylosporangium fulvum]UWP87430.1 sigma-70 family RNA polymerase sigma factor [Dactylosporangium fulvum]